MTATSDEASSGDTSDTTTTSPSTTHGAISDLRRKTFNAKLRLALLEQDTWWVPQAGWAAYQRASTLTVHDRHRARSVILAGSGVGPRLAALAEGEKVAIADMSVSWRQNVAAFMWRHTPGILHGLYWAFPTPCYEDHGDPFDARSDELLELMGNEAARRDWFEAFPFTRALRAATIDDRDARSQARHGVVLDGPAPAPVVTASGLVLA